MVRQQVALTDDLRRQFRIRLHPLADAKKAARIFASRRISSNRGVERGSGPSSKVSATR